ncbi:MFS general substrate transporter [Aaosphaeria arxii CBS 175.79]|uniref:MFS general substrate transporter n=1 Tax=Aaosphaeria arxii CBS 175.79 TaxID=1450172 RepID=A0A6A5XHJ4_9PLEO|nr:MFS general substrate transporter [Aaosphaeria arxii CBS 175.79]KAF2011784.1 MFS general substrate transporter [Aaosphaeria arxii CBS 175.79]
MASPLYRQPTRSEIIELAMQENHDADIPTNAGSICPKTSPDPFPSPEKGHNLSTAVLEKDVEKGSPLESLSSDDEEGTGAGEVENPNIVFWDGPDDPQNPLNWPFTKKWGTVLIVSAITFLTPLASSMFAPGVPQVMKTFGSKDDMLEGFMVSIYVLGFACGPMIIAPLSEMYGRLPLYHSCNMFFIIFTIAAAVATNMGMFITFRFFMGCFGGAPLVLGGGTIADLISREQRGTAMVVWMMGPTLGPCVGPIIGGFLTEAKGWRWNFWFVTIVAGAFAIISILLMSETSAPVILERKARRLRESTGNDKFRSKLDTGLCASDLFRFSIVRPIKMLTRSAICAAMSVYVAITYAYLYVLFTTFTAVFSNQYHWRGGVLGLSFLGLGVGSLVGQFVFTRYGNKIANKHITRGDFEPEHRLYIMAGGGFFLPIGLFWYGWSVQAQLHWMVPIVGTGVIGFGLLMTFMPANTYLVDVFTVHAASAMAANTVLRSLAAAFIPLSSQKMYQKLGYGWGNSLLGFVSLLLVPIPFLFIKYGKGLRARSTVKL